jgi:enoyl-CoA hydratase/carnithine racemase
LSFANIVVDLDGPVATITLNRPGKLNALSGGLLDDLRAARRELNPGLRAALAGRDEPYSTGPAADHDAAVRRNR